MGDDPKLSQPFPNCAFAAAHVNFPPMAYTRLHTDHLNHVAGLCALWAIGDYDPDKGGHLILWDLKLIIRFPPGNLILIPSALITHGNFGVYQGESRCAFVMFSAAGLFRWCLNDMRSDKEFVEDSSPERLEDWHQYRESLRQRNHERFPLWADLVSVRSQ